MAKESTENKASSALKEKMYFYKQTLENIEFAVRTKYIISLDSLISQCMFIE